MEQRDKALRLIADILEIDLSELTPETAVKDVQNWDSLAQLQIIGQLEDEFQVMIPIEDMIKIKRIDDLLNYIK